jgi:hypothetical protein
LSTWAEKSSDFRSLSLSLVRLVNWGNANALKFKWGQCWHCVSHRGHRSSPVRSWICLEVCVVQREALLFVLGDFSTVLSKIPDPNMNHGPFDRHLKSEHFNAGPCIDRAPLSEDSHARTVKLKGTKIQGPFKIHFWSFWYIIYMAFRY